MDTEVYVFVGNIHQRIVGNPQLMAKNIISFILFENSPGFQFCRMILLNQFVTIQLHYNLCYRKKNYWNCCLRDDMCLFLFNRADAE
jgi:hypothetical protein